jgi:hypothetical protein
MFVDPPNPLLTGEKPTPSVYSRLRIYFWIPDLFFYKFIRHMPCGNPECSEKVDISWNGWSKTASTNEMSLSAINVRFESWRPLIATTLSYARNMFAGRARRVSMAVTKRQSLGSLSASKKCFPLSKYTKSASWTSQSWPCYLVKWFPDNRSLIFKRCYLKWGKSTVEGMCRQRHWPNFNDSFAQAWESCYAYYAHVVQKQGTLSALQMFVQNHDVVLFDVKNDWKHMVPTRASLATAFTKNSAKRIDIQARMMARQKGDILCGDHTFKIAKVGNCVLYYIVLPWWQSLIIVEGPFFGQSHDFRGHVLSHEWSQYDRWILFNPN